MKLMMLKMQASWHTSLVRWAKRCQRFEESFEVCQAIIRRLTTSPISSLHSWNVNSFTVRGGADKSLARPGRKQATATKLRIYSKYSPRSSIHFLARCSNFCKAPPPKKNQKIVHQTKSPRQQWHPRWTKNGNLSIVFSVQEQVVVRRGQIRRIG